jgi:hypothetical protein
MDFILFGVIWDKKKDGGLELGELWGKLGPSKRRRTILGHGTGIHLAKWSVNEDMLSDSGYST